MKAIEEVILNTFKVSEDYLREENSMPANKIEDHALNYVNEIQKDLRDIQFNINVMKAELGKSGFEVEFEKVDYQFLSCSEGEKILTGDDQPIGVIPFYSGGTLTSKSEKPVTICKARKKHSDEVIVKTKAEVAEGDLPIDLLGEYLALARAARIILGDYNEN
ncbi:hypothetical protein [Halanaerobium salsuginis]|uniref:Uncharacterized protein n=1 Tax=Halanaerobium salsuginis TaxID=29563 RepID=A0A1I4EVM8_9FIRM|nr:hypothetical protein [Halanaerobium salsuginis]SFL09768.1 hypothetical protein SAMN02983006_00174 [Halanaerobium salsuginis]